MKRIFDILVSALALVILSPVLVLIAVGVRLGVGSPVIFRQRRPGKAGRIFEMWKFRTMTDARNAEGGLLSDGERLVALGRWLRSTSLDELPELWNVFKGDMSLVGPRPLLVEYLSLYSTEQFRRHEVKPGITGWAQINGRNALSWEDKFRMDVWYVDHHSLVLDFKILVRTAIKVLGQKDVSAPGHATMSKFAGSADPATRTAS